MQANNIVFQHIRHLPDEKRVWLMTCLGVLAGMGVDINNIPYPEFVKWMGDHNFD